MNPDREIVGMNIRLLQVIFAATLIAIAGGAQAQQSSAKPWYIAIGAGAAWYQDQSLSGAASGKVSFDTGFTLNAAIGRQLGSLESVRLELEGVHDRSDVKSFNGANASGTSYNYGLMFNLLYDIHTNTKWVPYLGVGAGWFEASFDKVVSGTTIVDDSDAAFAWQFKGGVAYELKPTMAITLGYRYLDSNDLSLVSPTGGNLTADGPQIQNLELGFRYRF